MNVHMLIIITFTLTWKDMAVVCTVLLIVGVHDEKDKKKGRGGTT